MLLPQHRVECMIVVWQNGTLTFRPKFEKNAVNEMLNDSRKSKMKLIQDEWDNDVWVWVDELEPDEDMSPRFDYKEDAINWYNYLKNYFTKPKKQ